MTNDEPDHSRASSETRLFDNSNSWKTPQADAFGWAIDGEAYFAALRASLEAAQHEILIVGWDIDSRVELIRDRDHPHYPSALAATLEELVNRKPDLRVHVLSWDFAVVYVLERELMPARAFGWHNSERLEFKLDAEHATGASHHQKIVVIDGALAYSGGLDLTKCRWDTRAHAADEPRRGDPNGEQYSPFHDVQAIVSGAAAAALRDLVGLRWQNATGENLPALNEKTAGGDLWPEALPVRAKDVEVAIARTWTTSDGSECIEEVKQLYFDLIAAAQRSIYIENQYFTSFDLAEALADRLEDEDGPEIVIVLPAETSGWLEQATMDILRNRAIERLKAADRFDRLRLLTPHTDELGDTTITVHAKLMVVDNRYCRIGSANLSRRSMSLDSECDLVVDEPEAATGLCADLLAEHLAASVDDVTETLKNRGLIATIEKFNGNERRFEPLHIRSNDVEQAVLEPMAKVADLEQPIMRATNGDSESDRSSLPKAALLLLITFSLVMVIWLYASTFGSDSEFSLQDLLAMARQAADHPLAPLAVPPAIVLGSLVFAPVTGMIAICALLFDAWVATLAAISGTLLATAVNHWLGRRFHDALMNRIPDSVTDKISSIASSSDVWSLAGLRLVPIAPFTAVNLAVGATGVALMPFLIGTAIAMLPGIMFISLSVSRARAALAGEPVFDPWVIAGIAAAGAAVIALRLWKNSRESD